MEWSQVRPTAPARVALAVVSAPGRQVAASRAALSLQVDGSSSPSGGPIITRVAPGSAARLMISASAHPHAGTSSAGLKTTLLP